ncbi:MAG: membrane protein insertion efficiency factor YidD [Thermaurantiacus sp.]
MSAPVVRRNRAGPVALVFIGLFSLWRLVFSPLVGPSCRFQPSCSAYGIEALRRHGAIPGLWLTLRRLARCHPWGGHGVDPVPDTVRLPFQPAKDRA